MMTNKYSNIHQSNDIESNALNSDSNPLKKNTDQAFNEKYNFEE